MFTNNRTRFIILCTLFILVPFITKAAESTTIRTQLQDIALQSIMAQNEILVHGSTDRRAISASFSLNFTKNFEETLKQAENRRNFLAEHDFYYDSFQTNLVINEFTMQASTARFVATEQTSLKLSIKSVNANAPEYTLYNQEHIFTFLIEGKNWKLDNDELINTPTSSSSKDLVPLDSSIPSSNPITPLNYASVNNKTASLTVGWLHRQSIIDYAYQYGLNPNPSYRDFSANSGGGDCTNFASQALYNGNWTTVSGFYQLDTAWWYNIATQTYTWVNAHKWNTFTRNRPRATFAIYVSDLIPGDILQADWEKDGIIDHTMIVTKKDNNGTLYLTYHTNNTVDRPFWDLYNKSPNANWYALHLMDIYDAYSTFLPIIQTSTNTSRLVPPDPTPQSPYPAPVSRSAYPLP